MRPTPSVFPSADPPAWATEWLASREQRAERAEARAAVKEAEPDPAARAKRIQARERKVDAGLLDLDRWLRDLVRRGLAAAKSEGYSFWDQAGARLVDAQAASLGREVRTLGAVANSGPGWADGSLERVARLHLIVEAYRRLDSLPEDLRADVRSLVGWTVKEDELPAAGTVADRWLVLGRTVYADDRLTTARTWLIGEVSNRYALHLAFGAGGANPPPLAMPGSSFRGELVFYPSATPLRVAVGNVGEPGPVVTSLPGASTIAAAADTFAALLARNPFLASWPVALADVVPIGRDSEMLLRDASAATVRAAPDAIAARLLALAGGHPVTVFGMWSGRSIRVLAALAEGRLIDLGTDVAGDGAGEGPSARRRRGAGAEARATAIRGAGSSVPRSWARSARSHRTWSSPCRSPRSQRNPRSPGSSARPRSWPRAVARAGKRRRTRARFRRLRRPTSGLRSALKPGGSSAALSMIGRSSSPSGWDWRRRPASGRRTTSCRASSRSPAGTRTRVPRSLRFSDTGPRGSSSRCRSSRAG